MRYWLSGLWRLIVLGGVAVHLGGCVFTPTLTPPSSTGTPALTATPAASPAPPTATPDPNAVRLWLLPQFAPASNTPGGVILSQQLLAFQETHPEVTIEIRIKAPTGAGSLLTALTAAEEVAPRALPNLVLLSRDDLVRAHQSGHLIALDTVLPADTLTPYYGFAQALGQVEGAWVGIPWAADARILVYDTLQYARPPLRWSEVITGPFLLPAAETSGLTLLTTYLALGGTVTSPSGQVTLDAEILAETLSLYQAAYVAEVIPLSTLTATDPETTWQLFRGQNAALAATSAHWYLTEYLRDLTTNATLLPTSAGEAVALADGWCWALVNATPEQQAQTVELLRWLTAPEQAGAWTQAADLLPTSPSSVRQWGTPTRTRSIEAILEAAQLQPSADVLAQVGPPLRQALEEVLSGRATPIVAATNAAQSLTQP